MSASYRVRWSRPAQLDLEGVVDFIRRERPQTALKILKQIRRRANSLRKNPQRGRKIPEFSHIRGLDIREILLSPWRLFYMIEGKTVYVLAFFDSRRDLEEVLFERLTRLLS